MPVLRGSAGNQSFDLPPGTGAQAAGDKWPVYLAMVNEYMDDNGGRRQVWS
jgi:hypothetical protein